MINAVFANKASFKAIEFTPGFNVILADRTETSGARDSRNGLGKSTLIEIIHFCLGSSPRKGTGLRVSALRGWAFSLNLTLANQEVVVTRSVDEPSTVTIHGDTSTWIIQPRTEKNEKFFRIEDWKKVLGALVFGLPIDEERQFAPNFRSLISYFIRPEKDAFSTPFEYFRKQPEWQKQVFNTFLLGLAWEDASDWQGIKEQEKLLDSLKKLKNTNQTGVATKILGSLGELEATRVRVEQQLQRRREELNNFRVHPQYADLQQEADLLTAEIHEITNENIFNRQILTFYQSSLEQESEPSQSDVARLYESAGVELPSLVIRRLEEVENFHHQIVENRREFLSAEVKRLRRTITDFDKIIREKTNQRASRLEVLQTHGALEEYTRLQELYLETRSSLNDINQRIDELRKVEEGKSSLRIERELLKQRALRDLEERHAQAERAITLFNANSQALYDAPGTLAINVGSSGFQFNVEIERDRSEGIGKMKIFCYDLMLAQLWSQRDPSPNVLIHDSTIFDGVDERQVALALELAARESERLGFKYICTLNSDMVPSAEFSPEFNFDSFVRLRLTDDEGGNLLGISF
ncbi:MAG: DUF2326 domain-containing protein [Trichocoleus desertorum ATA4-8-CV12]|jgi:uncharacterized protein YydD (DUF2326 family)|nr:DUF2326 domain-containing protein [Trichocoleus desertorum ATA4-8-CV12]